MLLSTISVLSVLSVLSVYGQLAGKVKQNEMLSFPVRIDGSLLNTMTTIDANWRWVHNVGGYTNCYDQGWNSQFCPDPITCAKNCELEGVTRDEYAQIYGVSTQGSQLKLKYVTGSNVGSRMYVIHPEGINYQLWYLKNKEFRFKVDVSKLPCGTNGAVYFVEMPANGGLNDLNKAGAPYGTGYGDAQGPKDIKFINGFANTNQTGIFSPEFDVWEANSQATAIASHPCSFRGTKMCTNNNDCGYNGFCDKDGADYNPYRLGNTQLYGPNLQVDTNKPFTILTRFITHDRTNKGRLIRIERLYEQNGQLIDGGFMTDTTIQENKRKFKETDRHTLLGGLTEMGNAMERGMVLVLSLWDDSTAYMRWLDSTYPPNGNNPGDKRGPCPQNSGIPSEVRQKYPNAEVIYSDVELRPLNQIQPTQSPTSTPTPTPTLRPTSTPTPTPTLRPTPTPTLRPTLRPTPTPTLPSQCQPLFGQCGGASWSGSTCCSQGRCIFVNDYYSQCLTPSAKCFYRCQECVEVCG